LVKARVRRLIRTNVIKNSKELSFRSEERRVRQSRLFQISDAFFSNRSRIALIRLDVCLMNDVTDQESGWNCMNGSILAVRGSGMTVMSDSLIARQPRIELPVKFEAISKEASVN